MTKRPAKVAWIGDSKHQERADNWTERGWRAVKIDTPDGKISSTIPWLLNEFPAVKNARSGNGVTLMIAGAVENRIVLCLIGDSQLPGSATGFSIALRPMEIRRLVTVLRETEKHAREIIRANQFASR
jgi:hypothetical protein